MEGKKKKFKFARGEFKPSGPITTPTPRPLSPTPTDGTAPPKKRTDETAPPKKRTDETAPPGAQTDQTAPPKKRTDETAPPGAQTDQTAPLPDTQTDGTASLPGTRTDETAPPTGGGQAGGAAGGPAPDGRDPIPAFAELGEIIEGYKDILPHDLVAQGRALGSHQGGGGPAGWLSRYQEAARLARRLDGLAQESITERTTMPKTMNATIQQMKNEVAAQGKQLQGWLTEQSRKIVLTAREDEVGRTLISTDPDHLRRFKGFVKKHIEGWGEALPEQTAERLETNLEKYHGPATAKQLRSSLPPMEAVAPLLDAQLAFDPVPAMVPSVSGSFMGILRQYIMVAGMISMALLGLLSWILGSQGSQGSFQTRYLLILLGIPLFLPFAYHFAKKKRAQQLQSHLDNARRTFRQNMASALSTAVSNMQQAMVNHLSDYATDLDFAVTRRCARWQQVSRTLGSQVLPPIQQRVAELQH